MEVVLEDMFVCLLALFFWGLSVEGCSCPVNPRFNWFWWFGRVVVGMMSGGKFEKRRK